MDPSPFLPEFRSTTAEPELPPVFPYIGFDPAAPRPTAFRPKERHWIQILLLLTTIMTTTVMGARFMDNFRRGLPPLVSEQDLFPYREVLAHPRDLAAGLPFSVTLLAILLSHEIGHFILARRRNTSATWPYVIPAPTLSGTMGAVIRIRSRIPNRRALFDIGIAGPIAGYAMALPCTFLGLWLSRINAATAPDNPIRIGGSLTVRTAYAAIHALRPEMGPLQDLVPHPVLVASWIGLFITALNLIPAGQLDGGHVLYAVSPRLHPYATRTLVVCLLAAGIFLWPGWLLWALILMLPAMRHPRVPQYPVLPRRRTWVSPIALLLFLLTVQLRPFDAPSLLQFIRGL